MPDSLDARSYDELARAIEMAQHTVYKRYLSELQQYPLLPPTDILLDETPENCIRMFQLKELSCKQGEDMFQKLTTVYHATMALGCSLIVMIDVAQLNAPARIYLGVRNNGADDEAKTRLSTSFRALKSGIRSNFPGTDFQDVPSQGELAKLLKDVFDPNIRYISSVSCVAANRDKSKTEHKSFVQGIERFVDSMQGTTYTALFLAEPISNEELAVVRDGYETLYSNLSSFQKSIWSYQESESEAVMESLSKGTSEAITRGTSHTQAHTFNIGANIGLNASSSTGHSTTDTVSTSRTRPTAVSRGGSAVSTLGQFLRTPAGVAALTFICPAVGPLAPIIGTAVSAAGNVMQGGSVTNAVSNSITESVARSMGLSGGLAAGYANTRANTTSESTTKSSSETRTTGTTKTTGNGRTLQIETVNKPIEELLQRIAEQLKRTRECEDYGAYSCCGYFLSGKQENSLLAANTYRALMLGDGSSVESGAINTWSAQDTPELVAAMKEYLRRMQHPLFAYPVTPKGDIISYTAGTVVSGMELPLHMGLPARSVYGLPVLQHAEFGRNILDFVTESEKESSIGLGCIYHMGLAEEKSPVRLNTKTLTGHTFVTGSTGSGKSNTIYHILIQAHKQGIPFLVIEPAKGEYKDALGGMENIRVLGTNPRLAPLLQINPFAFPDTIHVLEHIDRLVELFNACWPMYAAMPAILKDAIEQCYENTGWDMRNSVCNCVPPQYPTFCDLLEILPQVIQSSRYSKDTSSDYMGALLTRVRSLTTGINALLFAPQEIPATELFDHSTIVDLSRVASTEVKSLLMGLLVIKLQEYRMNQASGKEANQPLRHLTVLEEAHHLLRATTSIQTQENANLQGKSVELLANSISEMRTYGEGFIVADQAPGLLDPVVIRNTNTKIILRLPDGEDRTVVGCAAALNKEQIDEIVKLPQGVAVVYQSNWLNAVLCKIDRADYLKTLYTYNAPPVPPLSAPTLLAEVMLNEHFRELTEAERTEVRYWVHRHATPFVQDLVERVLKKETLRKEELRSVLYEMFRGKQTAIAMEQALSGKEVDTIALQRIRNRILPESENKKLFSEKICDAVLYCYCAELKSAAPEAEYPEILYQRYRALKGGAVFGIL